MEQNLHQTQIVTVIALIIFVIMIAIGIFSKKDENNGFDFLLGGRKIGAWVLLHTVRHIFRQLFL